MSRLELHRAKDPAERGVERVALGLELDRLVGEPQRRDVLLVHQELRGVVDDSTMSGPITVTSGGRLNGSRFQNPSARSAAAVSGRREPPPHR